jgi:hypothetical protein
VWFNSNIERPVAKIRAAPVILWQVVAAEKTGAIDAGAV